jgi:hypothetical protein
MSRRGGRLFSPTSMDTASTVASSRGGALKQS